ncbi:hypothetical protein [Cellulomonas sp. PhB150]|uniref:hypothetical protein n=1 Tax=Cellulomonas sp. PhB150 TaxID=2485188 RepID=UPI000F487354|nr:hypothetical protein [Cellulomonas sp. PhB150]ROS27935.1 hypothetical protein EDF34_1728 [Cellulomonas sp. PhB150]
MTTMTVARVRPTTLDDERIHALAETISLRGEVLRTDEAVALVGPDGAVVHGQPGNRMGGLTNLVDNRRGIADLPPETDQRRLIPAEKAAAIVAELTETLRLGPTTAGGLKLDVRVDARVTQGVTFDGKERRSFDAKTDVRTRVHLDGVPLSGPRAGVAATFLDDASPVLLAVTTWDAVEAFDEVEVLEKDEVVENLLAAAKGRRRATPVEVVSASLAYWAGPYEGGADLLEPVWFVEVAHAPAKGEEAGPRQLVKVAAGVRSARRAAA